MTLAAAYRIGRVPALLSDVLVSGPSAGQGHSPIPTRVDLNEPLPADWSVEVNGLFRKSLVVADNLALAVAGSGLGALVVCRRLLDTFAGVSPSAGDLAETLARCEDAISPATGCLLVGWIIDAGVPRSFRWTSTAPDQIEWDDDFLVGTGAELFQRLAWTERQRDWDQLTTFDHAQHYALMQIASLLVNELDGGLPLQNLFGGGYDLLLWDGERFRHGSGVSFLFLSIHHLRSSSGDETLAPSSYAKLRSRIALSSE